MNTKNQKQSSLQGRLFATITFLAVIIFSAQIVNAQANDYKAPAPKQPTAKPMAKPQTQAKPAVDMFNGKTFDVTVTEKGKATGDKDQLVFAGKKFEATSYTAKGYTKGD